MLRVLALAAILVIAVSQPATATCKVVFPKTDSPQMMLRVDEFMRLSEHLQNHYVMGFVDGVMSAGWFGLPESCAERLRRCVDQRSGYQLGAIVRKFINGRPDKWHTYIWSEMQLAIFLPCLG